MRQISFILGMALTAVGWSQVPVPVPLNTVPSRIVGHPHAEQLTVTSVNPNLVEGREFFQPQGIAVDTSVTPPILYVADAGNNRVLAWKNALAFKNGQIADFVIGQQDLLNTAPQGPAGKFQSGLTSPSGLLVDNNGNLYVADQGNNRILRYPKPAANIGNEIPDLFIGQLNIRGNQPNYKGVIAADGLNLSGSPFPINMAFDPQGNLWVTDAGNRRVLRFAGTDVASGGGPLIANLEIGQIDFTSVQAAANLGSRTNPNGTAFAIPVGIAFDSAGRLYVSDTDTSGSVNGLNRISVFTPPFNTNNPAAARIMGIFPNPPAGQTTPVSTPDQQDRTLMLDPMSIFFTGGASPRLGILDSGSNRVLFFDTYDKWPDATTTLSPLATVQFGQPDFHNRAFNAGTTFNPAASASTLYFPWAATFVNNELYVADTLNNRVVVLPVTDTGIGTATRILGQDNFTARAVNLIEGREFSFVTSITSNGIAADAGIVVDYSGDKPHLYVADPGNNRVLGFLDFRTVVPGSKADLVIGQPDLSSGLCNVTGNVDAPSNSTLCGPAGLVVDPNGNLYVADTNNHRVLRFPAPFAHQGQLEQADLVLGQRTFNSGVTDPTASTMSGPYGLAFAGSNGLLVSDVRLNRVLYIPFSANATFTAGTDNGKAATKVFGQLDFNGIAAGNTISTMSAPHHISTDNEARLYVADSGNGRVLIFDQIFSPNTPDKGANSTFQLTGLNSPRSVFVNPVTSEVWVTDTNSGTVKKYPIYVNLIFSTAPVATVFAASATLAVAQDQYGDLLVADSSNRVGFYFPTLQSINGGSFLANRTLAPGLLSSICSPGSACTKSVAYLGTDTKFAGDLPNPFPLPTTMGDVQVLFNGNATPLYYVSPTQINFLVPMSAPTSGTAEIVVVQPSTGRIYAAGQGTMGASSPAILQQDFSGALRKGLIVNAKDSTVNSPTNQVARGEYITIYATGQGFVPNAPPDGTPPQSITSPPFVPKVTIGLLFVDQQPADSDGPPKDQWVASVLSQYPGLWQINVYIPKAIPPGQQVPIQVWAGSIPSTDATSGFNIVVAIK